MVSDLGFTLARLDQISQGSLQYLDIALLVLDYQHGLPVSTAIPFRSSRETGGSSILATGSNLVRCPQAE
jgi:hypothetical protein